MSAILYKHMFVSLHQASPCVIEIHDSTTECEEEARPSKVPMEEKAFVASLHSFMKDKGTPIERIPHLGFKQSKSILIINALRCSQEVCIQVC